MCEKKTIKRIPVEDARHMLEAQYADFLNDDDDHVVEEWRHRCGSCRGLAEVDGQAFLDVDDGDTSFALDEYPDAPDNDGGAEQ